MQRRSDPVMLAWALGLGLAVLAYLLGPQYFLFRVTDWLHFALFRIGEVVGDLSLIGLDLVRALAIGLYGTFVLLSMMVIRRGGRAKAALFWITIFFLILIGPEELSTESNTRWVLALALAGLGALTMTNRLRQVAVVPPVY